MKLSDLTDKKITILGAGREGLAIASYLAKHGIKSQLRDHVPVSQWAPTVQEQIGALKLDTVSGEAYLDGLSDYEIIFRSPGIPLSTEAIPKARAAGAIITSQTKFFFENCEARIIGITGTKGKGTTSSLIYEALSKQNFADRKVYLTGNIGKTPALELLDELSPNDLVVFELSSFQLEDLEVSPHFGVCLMVTADHLDHHHSLEAYHAAKSPICKFQDRSAICVYNEDYPASVKIGSGGAGKKFGVSSVSEPKQGAMIHGNLLSLKVGDLNETWDCTKRIIRGQHNMENIAAAAIVCINLGVGKDTFLNALAEFKGLEHRLELVNRIDGVGYYNDSIATVPETTIAAMSSFTEPLIVIAGGASKGVNMEKLAVRLANTPNVKAIALMGEVGLQIKSLLPENHGKTVLGPLNDFRILFDQCVAVANPGDIVLLSPGAASFGMFKNYAERGNTFKQLVNGLGHDQTKN